MRLTLRTLLSWKDGMLAPEVAGELAAKVEASPAARSIVERIEEVNGRPTLSAPPPDAQGFAAAANSTAEYLDNVLPAERLAEFERVCFASEAQLAETAACHEILAAWSREPATTLGRAERRRLLAVVRSRTGSGTTTSVTGAKRGDMLRRTAAAERRSGGPVRPVRAPASSWLLLVVALLVLVTLVGVLAWSLAQRDGRAGGGRDVAARGEARREQAPVVAPPANAFVAADAARDDGTAAEPPSPPRPDATAEPAPAAADGPPANAAAVEQRGPAAGDMPAAEPAPDVVPPRGADGAPAGDARRPDEDADATNGPPPAAPPGDARVPRGDALAIAAPAAPAAAAGPAGPAPAAVQPDAAQARVAGSAVLLQRPRGGAADAWVAGVADAALDLPVDVVSAPFGAPTVVVDDVRIRLAPGTRAVLSRDADGTPRIEVVFGGASAVGAGRLGLTAGRLVGVVEAGLDAPVGVEVTLSRRPGAAAPEAVTVARIMPTAGRIAWRAADGGGDGAVEDRDPEDVAVGQALVWRSDAAGAPPLQAAGPLPGWLTAPQPGDRFDALAAAALERRLAAGTAAVPALRELASDRRVESRVAAAGTLALVGDFAEAVRLLGADGEAALPDALWSRLESVAVQPALARGPLATETIARAFSDHGPPGAAETIMRFARGFGDDELGAGAAAELVDALESPHLVVRRYAIKTLVEIGGIGGADRLRYRADRPPAALREGAAWWRARLERGLIVRGAPEVGPRP